MINRETPVPVLRIEHLTAGFDIGGRLLPAVEDVELNLFPTETLGLVGESGCGKTMTALATLRLLDRPAVIHSGRVLFRGEDLLQLDEAELRKVRGAGIGLVFQEPLTALNPVIRVGDQIAEVLVAHGRARWREARARAVAWLEAVRIPDPARLARDYPHQLSGGMRQRVMLAVALACEPQVLIADEPTTALDVRLQAEILDLIKELQQRLALAVLLITHDLAIVARTADRVAVMYAGRIVEEADVGTLFGAALHPYTRGLLASVPGTASDPGNAQASGARLRAIPGAVPTPGRVVPGCPFEPRCADRLPICRTTMPGTTVVAQRHWVRCHLHATAEPASAVQPACVSPTDPMPQARP